MNLTNNYGSFYNELSFFLPKDNIYVDEIRRLAWGTDASFYRLKPQMVVCPNSEREMISVLRLCDKYNIPITFRAAGTSLSGQAISDSVLLVTGKNWEKYSLSENAETITAQCGIVGGRINQVLSKYARKLGPDPASINSAMIGGIIMNNASGMNCGVHENSYKTIVGARIIFFDGTLLDTMDYKSCESFKQNHSYFIHKIDEFKTKIRSNTKLTERIKRKYSIKNTTGLSLNAFVDYEDPIQIILHLLVGSEGTLYAVLY